MASFYRGENNQRYTKQLFHETWSELPPEKRLITPPFSLYGRKEGVLYFGGEYIEDADPTGYTTSVRLLGDYGHWKYLMRASWFREAKKIWDEELDAKMQAEGLRKIREIANSANKGALQAARYLAALEYKTTKAKPVRGRPSTEEVEGRLAQEAEDLKEHDNDAARIGLLKVIN